MSKPLKLIAQSPEDMIVVSSLLQNMTVRVGDIVWQQSERRFAFIGNRFHWEKKRIFRRPKGERVRTAVHFSGIGEARITGFDLHDSDQVLELLDIETVEHGAGCQFLLKFAGGASIMTEADAVDAVVTDVSESWQAINRPRHD